MMKPVKLTLGIITCGRREKIKECLASIRDYVPEPYEIIVVDSLISDENKQLYETTPFCRCITFSEPISPAEARYRLTREVQTPLLLFLDDDIVLEEGVVALMMKHLDLFPEVQIVGTSWEEYGNYRELGQNIRFGTRNGGRCVFKTFEHYHETRERGLEALRVDCVHATMMARTEIFSQVNFDPKFGFFFELYDFFMQCKSEGIAIEALTGGLFHHRPIQYEVTTKRQETPREEGAAYFRDKWGLEPLGALGEYRQTLGGKILAFARKVIAKVFSVT